MFAREHSFLMRFFAILTLVVWSGAFHHDAWLDLFELDHHHDHHVVANQQKAHHHEGHSHSDDSGHDHRDTIPLPDTHTDQVTSTVAKVSVDGPRQITGTDFCLLFAVAHFLYGPSVTEIGHPPPQENLDHNPPALILLAHSVQSNAPPALS